MKSMVPFTPCTCVCCGVKCVIPFTPYTFVCFGVKSMVCFTPCTCDDIHGSIYNLYLCLLWGLIHAPIYTLCVCLLCGQFIGPIYTLLWPCVQLGQLPHFMRTEPCINASYLNSPTLHVQLEPVHGAHAEGVIKLPAREEPGTKKSYRVIGGPHNNAVLTLR